jgi:hypothetical protein
LLITNPVNLENPVILFKKHLNKAGDLLSDFIGTIRHYRMVAIVRQSSVKIEPGGDCVRVGGLHPGFVGKRPPAGDRLVHFANDLPRLRLRDVHNRRRDHIVVFYSVIDAKRQICFPILSQPFFTH